MWAVCHIENTYPNSVSYADDVVLLRPSIRALRELVNSCEVSAKGHGLVYKCECFVVVVLFKAGEFKPLYIPAVALGGVVLKIVEK